jgi:dihydrofolate synthase/folylpolyglutamate synthase
MVLKRLTGDNMTTKNIDAFLNAMDSPQHTYKTIHVGGSNGKGTTSYFIYQLLKQQGLKVGLYHSPYRLTRFDNIVIDKEDINKVEALYQLHFKDMKRFQLTPFEMDTAIMYLYFANEHVDIAVIEVGLGGTHDATNVIEADLSLITSVSLEHTEILGKDIESIIKVKSGIFKKNKYAIISPFMPTYEYSVFKSYIETYEAIEVKQPIINIERYDIPYLNQNLSNAISALLTLYPKATYHIDTLEELPFRFQTLKDNLIIDGAHNLEAVEALKKVIMHKGIKPVVIMSSLKTKPLQVMIDLLYPIVKEMIVTEFDYPDAYDMDSLKALSNCRYIPYKDIISYVNAISYDTIIITGSLYFLRLIEPILRSHIHETN